MSDTQTTETAGQAEPLYQAFLDAKAENSPEQSPASEEAVEAPSGDTEASATVTPEQPEAADQGEETADEQLLTDEQKQAIGNDPVKLEKELKKAFTQKTQALAAEKKSIAEWRQAIDLYERDPVSFIQRLAQHHNVQLNGTPQAQQTDAATSPVTDDFMTALRQDPEFGFLADRLEPVFKAFEKRLTDQVVAKRIAPLETAEKTRQMENAKTIADTAMKDFGAKHEGWEAHRGKMLELTNQLQPAPGMSLPDYLEAVWKIVSADIPKAQATKTAINRINNAVRNSEPATSGVQSDKVTKNLPKGEGLSENDRLDLRLRASFDAAKRGEVLGD